MSEQSLRYRFRSLRVRLLTKPTPGAVMTAGEEAAQPSVAVALGMIAHNAGKYVTRRKTSYSLTKRRLLQTMIRVAIG